MGDTVECVEIHNAVDKCRFYLETESCQTDGLLDYMYFIYCYFPSQFSWAGITLCILFLLLLFIALGVTADDFLCPSLVVITKTLRLSQNIAGVTFLAFGNGAPDIFSSMAGTEQSRPELVLGTLFGGGIFVTSVVAGSIMITKPFKIMERPFLRDIIFYVFAAFAAFLRFYYGEVTIWHSVGFIMLYIVYIFVVILSRVIYNKIKAKNPPTVPEIEIQSPDETPEKKKRSVSYQPTGEDEDNPEAAGVVLRRFSFRGSISVNLAKKRHSSTHAHHEHAIKAITQSASFTGQLYSNPTFTNGHPPSLESQISITSLSSLLTSNGEQTTLREFVLQVCPIDIEAWSDKSWSSRIFDIIKAPICALLIITVPVVDYENDKNNWCRPLCIIQCLTAPTFVIFAIRKYNLYLWNTVPLWAIIFIISLVIAIIVYCTSSNHCQPIYHSAFGFVGFVTSVIWVYLLASEIVSLLQTVGTIFKLSDAILGLTVLAWGNSIGDFISNLSVARQGYPRMGISACYGGPLLNLLLGIGIPYTISILRTGFPIKLEYEKLMTLLYSTLTIILLSTIMTMTAFRFNVKRYFGMILIGMYVMFLTIAIILETKVI